MNELVSIIVPIFNVEHYLERCLESIKSQTYATIEVLLIDDGSTDRSSSIAQAYADMDLRFKYYHKENGGLSSARNMGLEEMSGKYVSFIDSDDFIADTYVSDMVSEIDADTDIVIADYAIYEEKTGRYFLHGGQIIQNRVISDRNEKNKIIIDLLGHKSLFMGCCKNMYRASLIKDNNVKFVSERLVYAEDQLFNLCAYDAARIIRILQKKLYFHLIVSNSLSQKYRSNMLEMNWKRYEIIRGYLNEHKMKEVELAYDKMMPELIVDTVIMLCRCRYKEAVKNVETVLSNTELRSVLFNQRMQIENRKYKVVYWVLTNFTSKVSTLIVKILMLGQKATRAFDVPHRYFVSDKQNDVN